MKNRYNYGNRNSPIGYFLTWISYNEYVVYCSFIVIYYHYLYNNIL